MPVTPLVSTSSGTRSLYFGGPFTRIEDTADIDGPGVGLFVPYVGADNSPQRDPYPLIRWGADSDFSGTPAYSFQWLKNTTEFGVYYPGMNNMGSGYGSLSGDLANLTLTYDGVTIAQDYYKTIAVDDTVFALGANPVPLSGPINRPALGTEHVGYGFFYGMVDGRAEIFNVNVSPYYENGRYLIFTDGSKLNAFDIPVEFTPPSAAANAAGFNVTSFGTMNDGTYNYTVQNLAGGVNNIPTYLTKWQSSAYNTSGPFVSTAYSITLSDPTDDAIWQDYFAGVNGKQLNIIHNTNKWIFIAYDADAIVPSTINDRYSATVFIFNMDMTSYERVDVTFISTLNWASYFMDVDGLEYAIGSDPADGTIIYQVGGGTPPVDAARPLRGWTFTQDDHDFYVLRLTDSTYVFDKLTSQWCQWASPGLNYWSGSDGCDWQGFNVCCDPQTGDIHVIDPTGRLDDGTTPISTRIYGFVTTRFRKNVPMYMAEAAISEGLPPSGIDATTLGITLRTSDTLTWTNHGTVPGRAAGNMVTARWYGLGVATAPGVEFEIADTGYARRLDGFTVELGAAAEAAISNGQ